MRITWNSLRKIMAGNALYKLKYRVRVDLGCALSMDVSVVKRSGAAH
jgi:hypothetical protein